MRPAGEGLAYAILLLPRPGSYDIVINSPGLVDLLDGPEINHVVAAESREAVVECPGVTVFRFRLTGDHYLIRASQLSAARVNIIAIPR